MNIRSGIGMLVMSIDVPSNVDLSNLAPLAAPLQRFQVPATWAVDWPDRATTLLSWSRRFELALLGEAQWTGRAAGRTEFARGLNQRMRAADEAGVPVHTLAMSSSESVRHLDLLVKHRITWVRMSQSNPQASVHPQSLRYGVWQSYPTLDLPARSGWGRSVQPLALRGAVQRAAHGATLLHVRVSAGDILAAPKSIATLEGLCRLVSQRTAAGRLATVTLTELAQSLQPAPRRAPMRSILRAA